VRNEDIGLLRSRQTLFRIKKIEYACDKCVTCNTFEVNDIHGHQAGYEILREIARKISRNLRNIDCFGRYGGEGFLVILPHTFLAGAKISTKPLPGRTGACTGRSVPAATALLRNDRDFYKAACFCLTEGN